MNEDLFVSLLTSKMRSSQAEGQVSRSHPYMKRIEESSCMYASTYSVCLYSFAS